ncbi:hypothetical protein DID88_002322 [Monilinia fructigena]|uniref:Uncharacterized protein n=1 Tax=Monilinia fructigena TaxID=38457 RepID=A0A395ICW3_9HELO|nr:hypothetical protein DID88_002322 [Monilinia fructigena]
MFKGSHTFASLYENGFQSNTIVQYRTHEVKAQQQQAVASLKSQLLTEQLIAEMASVIVTKFFVFRQADLESWEEDEDEWEIREEGGGDTWEFEVRPCAEKTVHGPRH